MKTVQKHKKNSQSLSIILYLVDNHIVNREYTYIIDYYAGISPKESQIFGRKNILPQKIVQKDFTKPTFLLYYEL